MSMRTTRLQQIYNESRPQRQQKENLVQHFNLWQKSFTNISSMEEKVLPTSHIMSIAFKLGYLSSLSAPGPSWSLALHFCTLGAMAHLTGFTPPASSDSGAQSSSLAITTSDGSRLVRSTTNVKAEPEAANTTKCHEQSGENVDSVSVLDSDGARTTDLLHPADFLLLPRCERSKKRCDQRRGRVGLSTTW
jgi:hypothetical protein